jgi:cell division protein FtsZ
MKEVSLKIFGVGSAGMNILEQIAKRNLPGASGIAVGTRVEPLTASSAAQKILLEANPSRRPGTARAPEPGPAVAEAQLKELRAACGGAEVIFIVAGLGGSTATELAPVLARVAREAGAVVVAWVTLPFDCEGNRRRHRAVHGLKQLKAEADAVICLPNQKSLKLINDATSVIETFRLTNEWVAEGVSGVWRLLAREGLIEIHSADFCAMFRERFGESSLATADAAGPTRARDVADKLLAHPMLVGGKVLAEADAVLVGMIAGPDLTMVEVGRVMTTLNSHCERAHVMMGAVVDESFRERLAVTVMATRCDEALSARAGFHETAQAETGRAVESLESQLLERTATTRPQSRFVPPPPALPSEKIEQLMARQAAGAARSRKNLPRMRQGQLPLEIVSKGRFDKSEPTIHKGEDLDVPTYIRRGVALN